MTSMNFNRTVIFLYKNFDFSTCEQLRSHNKKRLLKLYYKHDYQKIKRDFLCSVGSQTTNKIFWTFANQHYSKDTPQ